MNVRNQDPFNRTWVTQHIAARVYDNSDGYNIDAPSLKRLISIQVDDYRPAEDEFKIEEFGVRRSYIYAPASRSNWQEAFRLARRLANNGMAQRNEQLLILPTVILLGGE